MSRVLDRQTDRISFAYKHCAAETRHLSTLLRAAYVVAIPRGVERDDAHKSPPETVGYHLDDQIGYMLRKVTQRHLALFSETIPEVTTTQFAVLARLAELGPQSQNHLGRATAMDAATIKGVVDRLVRMGLAETAPDRTDRRRLSVCLSLAGRALFARRAGDALLVSDKTTAPLTTAERAQLLALLMRLT